MVVLKLKKKKTSIPNLLPFSEMTSGWNRYSVKNNTQFVLQAEGDIFLNEKLTTFGKKCALAIKETWTFSINKWFC